MWRPALLSFLAACGSDAGEPLGGDIEIQYAGETITPTVGAIIPDPEDSSQAIAVLGTRNVSCETTLTSPLRRGTYLTFAVLPDGASQTPFVAVIRVESGGSRISGAAGALTIDEFGDRVTGSIAFETDDDAVGTVSATGQFDAASCL